MKKLVLRTPFATYKDIYIETGRYRNGNLYIEVMSPSEGPVITMTTCFPEKLAENEAYVDINNNHEAMSFIKEYKLGTFTGDIRSSGWCEYPKYKFDLERIAKYAYKTPKRTAIQLFEEALKEALGQAEYVASITPDNGTCNMDSCYVKLPRLRSDAVKEVCDRYEIYAYKSARTSFWDVGKRFGQASRNTAAQQKMAEVLREHGYEVYVNYLVD